jgi:hypothetical protein
LSLAEEYGSLVVVKKFTRMLALNGSWSYMYQLQVLFAFVEENYMGVVHIDRIGISRRL